VWDIRTRRGREKVGRKWRGRKRKVIDVAKMVRVYGS
jgi:hypothetical protein